MRLTTYLDLFGLLILVVAAGWGIWELIHSVPLVLTVSGLAVLAISWVIDAKGAGK